MIVNRTLPGGKVANSRSITFWSACVAAGGPLLTQVLPQTFHLAMEILLDLPELGGILLMDVVEPLLILFFDRFTACRELLLGLGGAALMTRLLILAGLAKLDLRGSQV